MLLGSFGLFLVPLSALVAFILSGLLLRPLTHLAHYLQELTDNLDPKYFGSVALPKSLQKVVTGNFFKEDEFSRLVDSLKDFLTQVRSALKVSMAHSARLAHEFNTPLAILKNELGEFKKDAVTSQIDSIERLDFEITRLGRFVHEYLEWSENLTNLRATEVYAIRVDMVASEMQKRLGSLSDGRIQVISSKTGTIFANPTDLEHVILNLAENALKYSEKEVIVEISPDYVEVIDKGSGISDSVLKSLGDPFNIGTRHSREERRGTGLGLALVYLISKKYRWKIDFDTSPGGTRVKISFPVESSQNEKV
jgi:signal transduction histidine kinase